MTVGGSVPPREGWGFESVDFGASALEEEEDHRLVAKANELMEIDSSPHYPFNGSGGRVSLQICFGDSWLYRRKAYGTIQSANKPP